MKILAKHEWNTGRLYGPDGQPIKAWLLEAVGLSFVYFMDEVRGIDGFIRAPSAHILIGNPYSIRSFVMGVYDHSQALNSISVGGGAEISGYNVKQFLRDNGEIQ